MVKGKKTKYGICVYDDELNHADLVVSILSSAFGYHVTQAYQCVRMIEQNGMYVVKTYDKKDRDKAIKYANYLTKNGLIAEIISVIVA